MKKRDKFTFIDKLVFMPKYIKLLRKYNTLENKYETLEQGVKDNLYSERNKIIEMTEELKNTQEYNKLLRQRIKELKNANS